MGKFTSLVLVAGFLLAACSSGNQSLEVDDGEMFDGSLATVNGSIRVGSDAIVTGGLSSVNGPIRIEAGSQVGDLRNVNGGITVGERVQAGAIELVNGSLEIGPGSLVNGPVSSVNGRIRAESAAVVSGPLSSVNGAILLGAQVRIDGQVSSTNGPIRLQQAEVGAIVTSRGNIEILDGSTVTGLLRVRPASGGGDRTVPRIVIGAGSRIGGPLDFEREVVLYAHESAMIGQVIGAEIRVFSGDTPPELDEG